MTINTSVRTAGPFSGAGVVVVCPFYFKVFAAADLLVVRTTTATGAQVTFANGGDYTVLLNADQDASPGGTVTTTAVLAVGYTLLISSNVAETQGAVLSNQGGFYPKVVEAALDRAVVLIQQIRYLAQRALRVPEVGVLSELPTVANRALKLLGFDSGGQPIAVAPTSGSAADLALDLVGPSGSSMVSFLQAGAGTVARTLQARGRETIVSSDFSGDAYTRIMAAIAEAKTRTSPHLVIEPGTLAIGDNTLVFDVPNGTRIDFLGEFTSTAAAKTAVQIGKASANTWRVTWTGLKVARTSNDYSGSSVGVELLNLAACTGDIRQTMGFRIGVMPHGNSFGCVYNKVSLGQLHDNRDNFVIRVTNPAGGGYCNENLFEDGSFNHSSSYDVATYNGRNIVIEYNATNQPNDNIFIGPSLEDAHPSSSNTVAAEISGANNLIIHPRLERIFSQSTYQIKLTVNSTECQILGNGFSLLRSNIDDLGSNNCWETREGRRISHQVPDDVNKGVIDLMSSTTSAARLLRFLDSSGALQGSINGSGLLTIKNITATNLGTHADDAAAATGGVPINGLYVKTGTGAVHKRVS